MEIVNVLKIPLLVLRQIRRITIWVLKQNGRKVRHKFNDSS